MRRDLRAALERDPAARSALEVALTYPGVHAIWAHRVAHRLWVGGRRWPARLLAAVSQRMTGVDIHPAACLGPGLFIDHAIGVVIGETAEVGEDVTLYHGVTLGGTHWEHGKRHPTIGDRVTIGAGAKVLGPIEVGADSRIGANAVVIRTVPANSVVVGVPGQIVRRGDDTPRLDDSMLPDVIATTLSRLTARIEVVENCVDAKPADAHPVPEPDGVWSSEDFDFSI